MPGPAAGPVGQIVDRGDRTQQCGGVRPACTAGVDRRQHRATSSGPAIRRAPDQGAGGRRPPWVARPSHLPCRRVPSAPHDRQGRPERVFELPDQRVRLRWGRGKCELRCRRERLVEVHLVERFRRARPVPQTYRQFDRLRVDQRLPACRAARRVRPPRVLGPLVRFPAVGHSALQQLRAHRNGRRRV